MLSSDVHVSQLQELLRRLVRGIGLLDREDAACCGITLSQCHALGEVATQEGLTPGELAVRLGVDPSAITRVTDALVQGGLLSRRSDPSDRRLVRLFLTPEGRSLWDGIHSMMMERSRAVIEHLSPDERPVILAALEHLVEALEHEGYLSQPMDKGGSRCEQQGT